jgi:inosine-uridine nucleoside N-ribohydrolase
VPKAAKKYRMVLDCDTKNEIDDQFAIAYAYKSPHVKLEGVISVQNQGNHGVESIDIYHDEAKRVLRLAGGKCSAYKGSRHPVSSLKKPDINSGVEYIIESARIWRRDVTIVATGPATNIANACLAAPDIMKRTNVVWIGGFRSNEEMRRKPRECNFVNDKKGAGVMFDADLHLTLLPGFGVADRMMMQVDYFAEQLKARGLPLTRYLAKLIDSVPQRHRILWDIAAVTTAHKFGVDKMKKMRVPVVERGKLVYPSRGTRMLPVVDSIDEFAILSEARKRILA